MNVSQEQTSSGSSNVLCNNKYVSSVLKY